MNKLPQTRSTLFAMGIGILNGVVWTHVWNQHWRNKPQYTVIERHGKHLLAKQNWKWDCEGDTPCTKTETGVAFLCEEVTLKD